MVDGIVIRMHDASSCRAVRAGAVTALCLVALAGCPAPRPTPPSAQASAASAPPSQPVTTSQSSPSEEASTPGASTMRFVAPEGGVQRGTKLSFTLSDGGTKISDLVADVLETCDGEAARSTTVGPDLTWDVVDGSFSGRLKEVAGGVSVYTTLEGRFTSATTVEGTIRQESVVAGSVCDTYNLTFTAESV